MWAGGTAQNKREPQTQGASAVTCKLFSRSFCQVLTRKIGARENPLLVVKASRLPLGAGIKPCPLPQAPLWYKTLQPLGEVGQPSHSQSPGKEPPTASGERAEAKDTCSKKRWVTSQAQDCTPTQSRNLSKTRHRHTAEFCHHAEEGQEC